MTKVEVKLSGEQVLLTGGRGRKEEARSEALMYSAYNVSCTKISSCNTVPGMMYTDYEFS